MEQLSLARPLFTFDGDLTDLHGFGDRLRAAGPIVPVELPGGVAAWFVTGEAAAREVFTHPKLRKNIEHWGAWQRGEIPEGWPLLGLLIADNMLGADGMDHKRLRTLVSKAFTARRVEKVRPRIEALVAELLDGLDKTSPDESVDLKKSYAQALPMAVICEIFGVPDRERQVRMVEFYDQLMNSSIGPEQNMAAMAGITEMVTELVADKRGNPGDDLTTDLVAVRDDGDRLSEKELVDTLILMILAGHETTVNLIANAVRALLGHPEQLAMLRAGTASWGGAIEEVLRWNSPALSQLFRYPIEDIEIAGQRLATGEPMLIALTTIGRDEGARTDASRFDITRAPNSHVSFGHGAHFCVGAPLARLEAGIALPALFARFPELELAIPDEKLVTSPSLAINGLVDLPVRLGTRRAADRP
jgi:cytochrome P450